MRKSIRDVVAKNIAEHMERNHLSANRLAALAGVSQTHLAKVLRCEAAFSTDKLAEVAKGLGVEPWELLVDSEAVRERAIRHMLQSDHPKKNGGGNRSSSRQT